MTFGEFKAAIQGYVADYNADVSAVAADSLRYLSNHFANDDMDTSLTGNGSLTAFTKPTGTLSIYGVKVAGEEHERIEMDERDRFEVSSDLSLERYYETATQIIFLVAPASGAQISIDRKKCFTVPTTDGTTLDVPTQLLPLLILVGAWFFYIKRLAQSMMDGQLVPDGQLSLIRQVTEMLKTDIDAMILECK